MEDSTLTQWPFENGGPAIRYRTAAELMSCEVLKAFASDEHAHQKKPSSDCGSDSDPNVNSQSKHRSSR